MFACVRSRTLREPRAAPGASATIATMLQHYDQRARGCVVLAREESIRLGRAETGAEHLLLGIAALDPDLVGIGVEPLRAALVALHGVGSEARQEMVQLSADAIAALEGANAQALALGHTTI